MIHKHVDREDNGLSTISGPLVNNTLGGFLRLWTGPEIVGKYFVMPKRAITSGDQEQAKGE